MATAKFYGTGRRKKSSAWATPYCYVLRCSKPAVSQNQSFRLIKPLLGGTL